MTSAAPGHADSTALLLRSERWIAERVAKAQHLDGEGSGIEQTFLAVEHSVEAGRLGAHLLGLAVYEWLFLVLAGIVLILIVRLVRRRLVKGIAAAALLASAGAAVSMPDGTGPEFLPDDPLHVDPDTLAFPAPQLYELSEAYDFVLTATQWADVREAPAINVNTLGQVPASSWFADRHYRNRLSQEQLRGGLHGVPGPTSEDTLNVVDLERDGKSVGMQIVDGNGDRYFVKFDPKGHPETTTGAEIISSRILEATGYHVPANSLMTFSRQQLQPGRADIRQHDIEAVLARAHRRDDGRYRALLSKHVEGRPIGPFRFFGTRADDANDIFPHELRRELRGLRVIAAWINHVDVRAENTLVTVIEDEDGAYAKHYLIDFGTTLGGSPLGMQRKWAGYEHWGNFLARKREALSFGLADVGWDDIAYPDIPGVGRFESDHFDPAAWVPIQPNPAFRQMDAADAFWAAVRIAHWTHDEIAAAVSAGEFSDPRAEAYLIDVLVERRRKILEAYLPYGGGLDRLHVEADSLRFVDLLERFQIGDSVPTRTVVWTTEGGQGEVQAVRGTSIPIPVADRLTAQITTAGLGLTRVYIRDARVVGIERCAEAEPCRGLAATQDARRLLFDGRW